MDALLRRRNRLRVAARQRGALLQGGLEPNLGVMSSSPIAVLSEIRSIAGRLRAISGSWRCSSNTTFATVLTSSPHDTPASLARRKRSAVLVTPSFALIKVQLLAIVL
jgi:hypothetical protein